MQASRLQQYVLALVDIHLPWAVSFLGGLPFLSPSLFLHPLYLLPPFSPSNLASFLHPHPIHPILSILYALSTSVLQLTYPCTVE